MAAIKKWNGSVWEETYPKTTVGNIVTTGTPSSTTFLSGTGVWATPAGTSNHSHGNINSSGQITSAAQTVANGDYLLIRDVSNSSLVSTGPVFGTSTTTFLANDGVFRTTGDVVGPASSVANRFVTFNGTTGKLIQDSGFTTANIAGNSNTSFWNPTNNSIPVFSTGVGWYTTTTIPGLTYTQRITNDLLTGANTNWVTVFSFTNLPAGTYQFLTTGRWQRDSGGVSRGILIGINGSSNYTNLTATAMNGNAQGASLGTAAVIRDLYAATSTLGLSGSFLESSSSTASAFQVPFSIHGTFVLSSTTTMTVSMRQSASSTTSFMRVVGGATMNIIKVA